MMNTSLLFFILFSITLKKKLREAEEPKSVAIKQKEAYISKSQFLNIRYKSIKLSIWPCLLATKLGIQAKHLTVNHTWERKKKDIKRWCSQIHFCQNLFQTGRIFRCMRSSGFATWGQLQPYHRFQPLLQVLIKDQYKWAYSSIDPNRQGLKFNY